MKILIFEDEFHTADRLINMVHQYNESYEILEVIATVEDGIKWFKQGNIPDLIFQDIYLADGDCFKIYETVNVSVPIIFTTAYKQYALKSFELNSIDYIVKPYDYEE